MANQTRFVVARRALAAAKTALEAGPWLEAIDVVLDSELQLAKQLYRLQIHDSRLGFEASNQYYYVPIDLAEKVINCRDLRDRWLAGQRAHWEG